MQTALARNLPPLAEHHGQGLADAYTRRVMISTRTEWWRARKLDLPAEEGGGAAAHLLLPRE